MFSSGGMGLFFNGAENWGLAFGCRTSSDNKSSLSFTQSVGHCQPDSQFQVSMCPHVDCLEVLPLPSCPVRWTGMDVCVYWEGGSCTAPASCPLLADPSPPLPLCLLGLRLSALRASQSSRKECEGQAQVAQGSYPPVLQR